jgi:hypothetical protein
MKTSSKEHAGSGIDKPDPKTLVEKLHDGLKTVMPKIKSKEAPKPIEPGM